MSAMGVERAQVVDAFADLAALKLATMCDGALLVCHTNEPTQHLRPLLGWWGSPKVSAVVGVAFTKQGGGWKPNGASKTHKSRNCVRWRDSNPHTLGGGCLSLTL